MDKRVSSTTLNKAEPPAKKIYIAPESKLTADLLCSRIYNLNSSLTKKVIVGLVPSNGCDFTYIVKIIDNNNYGICLTNEDWNKLVARFDEITAYFEGEGECTSKQMIFNGSKTIQFKNIYERKSLIIRDDTPYATSKNGSNSHDDEPVTNHLKSPMVVIQRNTFNGLKNVSRCIEYYSNLLGAWELQIQRCQVLMIDHIYNLLCEYKETHNDEAFIRDIMMRKNFNFGDFMHEFEYSFRTLMAEIVCCELLVMNTKAIVTEVYKKLTSKRENEEKNE